MNKIVLITGATSGFGEACARQFAAGGYRLIITGRRKERLEALTRELQAHTEVFPLVFDVQDKEAVFAAINSLPDTWTAIDILINNAGLALGRDHFQDASLDDWETMLDTNVKGLLYVSRAVVPLMIARQRGHIINLGSIAGKEVYEKGNVYCASKFAVDAISKAQRIDLLQHRIKVTAIHPGAADTEFSRVRFKGDMTQAAKIYEGYTPLRAEDVADAIYYCASTPGHVCINEVNITCLAQANSFYYNRSGNA
jgi:NADP-dependent 3-hydroxy acid dehydrogenase YdfG